MVNRKYQRTPHHGKIRLRALKNHRSNFVSRAKRIQFPESVCDSCASVELQLHIRRTLHAHALPIDRSG